MIVQELEEVLWVVVLELVMGVDWRSCLSMLSKLVAVQNIQIYLLVKVNKQTIQNLYSEIADMSPHQLVRHPCLARESQAHFVEPKDA